MTRIDSANCRVYGGKSDEDINVHNQHTVTRLKMVSLCVFMLEAFKHKGHCVVMDSDYMGDDMCLIGRENWGTCWYGGNLSNRILWRWSVPVPVKADEIVIGSHDSLFSTNTTQSN